MRSEDIWQRLGDLKADEPDSQAMRARFDAMLAEAQREQAATEAVVALESWPAAAAPSRCGGSHIGHWSPARTGSRFTAAFITRHARLAR
jgi:hypothetical protein